MSSNQQEVVHLVVRLANAIPKSHWATLINIYFILYHNGLTDEAPYPQRPHAVTGNKNFTLLRMVAKHHEVCSSLLIALITIVITIAW